MPKIDRAELDSLVAHSYEVLSGQLKDSRGLRIVLDIDHILLEKAVLSILSVCAPDPIIPSDIEYVNMIPREN